MKYENRELELGYRTFEEVGERVARFLDPVLQGQAKGAWDPATWSWY